MKTSKSAIACMFAASLAAWLGAPAQAEAGISGAKFLGIGFTVGYSFDEKGGHHTTFGPMITLNYVSKEYEPIGVAATLRGIYSINGGWLVSAGVQAGRYAVEIQPKLEFGLGYHMPYDERPGGLGLHLGFSAPIGGGIIDMGPSVRTFQPLSQGPLSEWSFGGDIWLPGMAAIECRGCG